jgi:hypothetical protein
MLKISFTLNQQLGGKLKDLPPKIKSNFKTKLRTKLRPELEELANSLLNVEPGPVSEPFEFGTPRSKRYYIILVKKNPGLTDGQHWKRRGLEQEAFRIMIRDYVRADLISLVNIQRQSTGTEPYPARYTYGPWAVAGHINTGWPALLQRATPILRTRAIDRAIDLGNEALREAKREATL